MQLPSMNLLANIAPAGQVGRLKSMLVPRLEPMVIEPPKVPAKSALPPDVGKVFDKTV